MAAALDLEQYWSQGFALLPRLFEPDLLTRFETRFVDLALGRATPSRRMVIMRDIMVVNGSFEPETPLHGVNKLLSFEDDDALFQHSLHPPLLEAVRALVGPELITLSTNVFNKPPGVDGRHPLHQDLRYFSLRPADRIIAAWTAISACTRANGCLAVVPGSHRGRLRGHATPDWDHVNFGFFAADEVDLEARMHVPMEPGDTLLFHPLLLHGSGRNRSDGFRRAISTHYASAECERPALPRNYEPVTRRIPGPGAGASVYSVAGASGEETEQ